MSTVISRKDIFTVFGQQNNPKTHLITTKSTMNKLSNVCLSLTALLLYSLKTKDGAAVNKV